MTYFLKNGDNYNVTSETSIDLRDHLPAGTYTVKFNDFTGQFFLTRVEDFTIGHKLYGDTQKLVDRFLSTFLSRDSGTGVMLSGLQGSGKSLTAKVLSTQANAQGIPTIVVNQPWAGEEFNGFIQSIEQPVVIIFDEFEKVYDPKTQEKMLTLLDGVYPTKKLFVITCNDKYRINEHMRNRPGRIFYRVDFEGLAPEFIEEYCQDNLKNKSYVQAVGQMASAFTDFNFDILKGLVEEMNRYDESPSDALRWLNAKPEYSGNRAYTLELSYGGQKAPARAYYSDGVWSGNPLASEGAQVYFYDWTQARAKKSRRSATPGGSASLDKELDALINESEEHFPYREIEFQIGDLVSLDKNTGAVVFRKDGFEARFTKKVNATLGWDSPVFTV